MPQLKQFHMVNIDMFRHPKYYKELRKRALDERNKSDQVISSRVDVATSSAQRAPGPGHKQQARGSWTLQKVSSTLNRGAQCR